MANGIRKSKVKRLVNQSQRLIAGHELILAWQQSPGRYLQPITLDDQYKIISEDAWRAILQHSGIDKFRWVKNFRDCDKFAKALAGTVPMEFLVNSIGVVADASGKHAYVVIVLWVDDKLVFRFIEPQSDKWITTGKGMYKLKSGFVLF